LCIAAVIAKAVSHPGYIAGIGRNQLIPHQNISNSDIFKQKAVAIDGSD